MYCLLSTHPSPKPCAQSTLPAVEDELDDDEASFREQRRFLQRTIIAYLADHEDVQAALRWGREVLPVAFEDVFSHPDPEMNARAAYWVVWKFWNAMPLASNGFQPKPLPEPRQDGPCPCGSGDTYATCCLWMRSENEPRPEHLWPALVETRSDAYWLSAEKAGELPNFGVLSVAARYRDAERWLPLRKLVEARLAVPSRCADDADIGYLIEWLCDSYDALHTTSRKKLALLRRFAKHETPAVRGCANRRLATVMLDAGDKPAAWAAAEAAREAQPESPETALFEMTMLVGEGDMKGASERARYWQHRLADADDIPDSFFDTLEAFAENPSRAFEDALVEDAPLPLRKLLDWIDENTERPLPRLRWRALSGGARGASPSHEKPMKDIDDDERLRHAHVPVVARNHRRLEEEWLDVSGMEKPFSTNSFSAADEECWRHSDEWVGWLGKHPRALDSLTILDDLAILLAAAHEHLGMARNRWVKSVLARGVAILAKHWPPERTGKLPWVLEGNRPALRLLASYIEERMDDWEEDNLEPAMNLYLRLNPNDNHGFRAPLVNHLLTEGRDADALACADGYPDDMFAETRYGAVLALYRLGRLAEAETRLAEAKADLPRVLRYLVRTHIRRPKLRDLAVTIGGDDQAWLYREEMRAVWTRTDGAIEWLRRFAD